MRKTAFVLAVLLLLTAVMTGCSSELKKMDWDAIKNDDIVLTVQGDKIEVSKKAVAFYCEYMKATYAYYEAIYEEVGKAYEKKEVNYDKSLSEMSYYALIAYMARMTDDVEYYTPSAARDLAYQDFIVRQETYSGNVTAKIIDDVKANLYLSDKNLVNYGGEYYYLVKNAESYVKYVQEQLKSSYTDENALATAVQATVNANVANVVLTYMFPDGTTVSANKIDCSSTVASLLSSINR